MSKANQGKVGKEYLVKIQIEELIMINEISALTSSTDGVLKAASTTRYTASTPDLGGTGAVGETSFSDAMAKLHMTRDCTRTSSSRP